MVSSPVSAATIAEAPTQRLGRSAFISYASQDRRHALRVATALEDAGIGVWLDILNIPGGQSYGPEIVDGIRSSTALVVLCSAASLSSRNVRQEIQLAWRYGRPILPLRLEDVTFPDELAYWLEGAQWIDILDQPPATWLPRIEAALARFASDDDASSSTDSDPAATAIISLPVPPTAILGRERELAELRQRQESGARLLTLTGPGGAGKTRLALEAAHEWGPGFAHGAVFVDLSAVTDPAMVIGAIAEALGLREAGGDSLVNQVHDWLKHKRLLLVLDNVEQVLAAAPDIAALLAAAPGLTILATSRAPLLVRAEQVIEIGPLALPDTNKTAAIVASPAVALFLDRARAAGADLALSEENARAIGEIVRRVDGLPLAIELAAARAKLFPPEALLARLERRLPLLTGGAMDAPTRQRTLRDTIAWSYDLLSPAEQTLLQRLAVFAGDASFEAVETVTMPIPGLDLYDGLATLMRHSLLRQVRTTGEPRFRQFETIREFALEQLDAGTDGEEIRQRHAAYFLNLAEQAEPVAHGLPDRTWLQRLEADHDNLRAVLARSVTANPGLALRLSAALGWFWDIRGYLTEGRSWLRQALSAGQPREVGGHLLPGLPDAPAAGLNGSGQTDLARAKALWWMGELAECQMDLDVAEPAFTDALAIYRSLGDQRGTARSLHRLGHVAVDRRQLDAAAEHYTASLAAWQAVGDDREAATVLAGLGNIAYYRGETDQAIAAWTDAIGYFRTLGEQRRLAMLLSNLGAIAFANADVDRAEVLHEEALTIQRELGEENALPLTLNNLAWTLQVKGDFERARPLFEESLRRYRAMGMQEGMAHPLYGLAWLAWDERDLSKATALAMEAVTALDLNERPILVSDHLMLLAALVAEQGHVPFAAQLLGATAALREAHGGEVQPVDIPYKERLTNTVRERLDPDEMERLVALGRERSPQEMLTETLALASALVAGNEITLPPI